MVFGRLQRSKLPDTFFIWEESEMAYPKVDFLYLNEEDMVRAGVKDMAGCIDAMEEMFKLMKVGDYRMGGANGNSHGCMVMFPPSSPFPEMPVDGPDRRFMAMPAYLGGMFDMVAEEDLFGENTWEEAESTMQKEACLLALGKAHLAPESIRYLFGGDLLRQGVATSMGVETLQIPMFGLYGACSTSGEALALASMSVAAGYGERMLAVTSSHFGSAEKEFRFPLGYANQRPLSAHWTVTGSGAFIVGKNRSHVRITGVTVGKIVDYGLKDSQNMGACMAPAACDTIIQNLEDFERKETDYDRIITGDLGYVGQSILFDLMRGKEHDIKINHMDCGMTIFDQNLQDTHAGGSGCGCAAATLSAYILPKISRGEWKRVLFVPTGALMSTVSYNEGASVPGIAHGIVLEHC